MDEGPSYVDISQEQRPWSEVTPDQWFYPDHVTGREVSLQIKSVQFEENSPDRPILTFHNDEKWLGVSRENRLVLGAMFGPPASCIDQWITITAAPNWRRVQVIKILPRSQPTPKPESRKRTRSRKKPTEE